MTTDLRRLMQDAADGAPTAHRLVADARAGAQRLQRRRRAVATATVGTALGAGGLLLRGALPAPGTGDLFVVNQSTAGPSRTSAAPASMAASPSSTGAPATASPAAALPDCDGSTVGSSPQEVPASEVHGRFLGDDPAYQLQWVQARAYPRVCQPAPAALVLTDAAPDGIIRRAVTVRGPRQNPVSYAGFVPPPEPVTVRGVEGQAALLSGATRVSWTEPGGGSWEATGSGLTQGQLGAFINQLAISGSRVSVPQPPDGFASEPVAAPGDAGAGSDVEWSAAYLVADNTVTLSVSERPRNLLELVSMNGPASWRFTSVRGHRGVSSANGSRPVMLSWEERPGLWLMLVNPAGTTTTEALVAFADTLKRVDADDPRITTKLQQPPDTAGK